LAGKFLADLKNCILDKNAIHIYQLMVGPDFVLKIRGAAMAQQ
jgi:hypothetical protein